MVVKKTPEKVRFGGQKIYKIGLRAYRKHVY